MRDIVPTSGVRNLIREGKNHQIYSATQTGGKFGMQTMDAALVDLVRKNAIRAKRPRSALVTSTNSSA
jgi:twitching motility protein PilT